MTARVIVSVGTDVHHFDRLVEWVERWADKHVTEAHVVVQHGTTRAPEACEVSPMYPHTELVRLMGEADAVVVQGGPGGVIDALGVGRMPVVVPRRHDLGEHVDDHQVAFSRFMASRSEVLLAEDEETLTQLLDRVLVDRGAYRVPRREPAGPETSRRIGELVGALVGEPARAGTPA